MRPVPDDGTNVPATVATTGTRVAKVDREREVPTLGDALVMLGSTLQQMQADDVSVEVDADRERVRLRFRAYKHRNGGDGNGA